MNFTNRIRFESVIKTADDFISPDLDKLLQAFIRRIGEEAPGGYVSASINITHEQSEKVAEMKGFIPVNAGEEIIFGRESQIQPQASYPSGTPTPVDLTGISSASVSVIEGETLYINPRVIETPLPPTRAPGPQTTETPSAPEPISEVPQEVKPPILNGTITTLDVIDALSRIKEIGVWLDHARVIMEDVPKIRNEIKDLTENLLKVLQNGQNGNSNNGQ